MKRRLRINGFIMFVAVSLIALFPAFFFRRPDNSISDEVMDVFGVVFILLGQLFRASARGYKSEYSDNGNALIRSGPYALVRNPMYLGIFFIGMGIILVLFEWWAMLIFLSVFIMRYLTLILREEKKLSAAFPQDYPDYRRKVPRIFPSIASVSRKDIRECLPLKLPWLAREIGSIIAILFVVFFLESWKDIETEGRRAYIAEGGAIIITVMLFAGLAIYLSARTAISKRDVAGKG